MLVPLFDDLAGPLEGRWYVDLGRVWAEVFSLILVRSVSVVSRCALTTSQIASVVVVYALEHREDCLGGAGEAELVRLQRLIV